MRSSMRRKFDLCTIMTEWHLIKPRRLSFENVEPLNRSTTQQSQETLQFQSTLKSSPKGNIDYARGASNICEEKGCEDLDRTIFLRQFYCKFQNSVFQLTIFYKQNLYTQIRCCFNYKYIDWVEALILALKQLKITHKIWNLKPLMRSF